MIYQLRNKESLKIFIFLLIFGGNLLTKVHSASEEELGTIFLRLYTGKTVNDSFHDTFTNESSKLIEFLDLNKPTIFYIHGFTESVESESVKMIVEAYLIRQDHNIIAADYNEIAGKNYITSIASASSVGKILAKALDEMVLNSLNRTTLHVIGHSLGGQVAAYLSRNLNFTLSRITGLDPAGPGFYLMIDHLTSKDAKFVDVIHTDAGIYGNAIESGDIDFYPNNGIRIQPGCSYLFYPLDENDFCSHHRSWRFYAESVRNETAFIGIKCESAYKFETNQCKYNKKVEMGIATPFGTKGSFYLETNNKSPFGRGKDGVRAT